MFVLRSQAGWALCSHRCGASLRSVAAMVSLLVLVEAVGGAVVRDIAVTDR